MHVEMPKAKKFKEFGGEYVMIVISIITALGLEHAVQTYHHRQLAHEATERIEAELRDNAKGIASSLSHNEALQKRVAKLRSAFLEDLKRGTPEQVAIEHMLAQDKVALDLAVHSPTLRHEAWDVAVANQAASWIEPARLERYAALYAHMRDVDAISNGAANRFFDGPQMVNIFSDLEFGKGQARDLLRLLKQMETAYGSADGNLINLRDDLAEGFAPKATEVARR
ncbi:MAG: hypothetical protein ACXWC4_16230 [Telluria sp.]